jgi:hypothetical protein
MRRGALILALMLAACSGADERAPDTPPTGAVAAAPAPTPAPARTSAAARVDCQDERNGGYDNAKVCYYDQCDKGDLEACGMAESFNGNMFQEGGADPPEGLPVEEMSYLDARKIILGKGWVPLQGPCSGFTANDSCSDFPEVGYCQGTGLAHCDMNFRRGERCLVVVTTGGYPNPAYPEDSLVQWVRFHDAPCKKDPNDP